MKQTATSDLKWGLEQQLPDELKANSDYNKLADIAERAGLTDIARGLRGIAAEEKRHYDTIAMWVRALAKASTS